MCNIFGSINILGHLQKYGHITIACGFYIFSKKGLFSFCLCPHESFDQLASNNVYSLHFYLILKGTVYLIIMIIYLLNLFKTNVCYFFLI